MTKKKTEHKVDLVDLKPDELNFFNFGSLLLKRVGFLFIKMVGSRKSFYHLYNVALGNYLMYFFASNTVVPNAMMIFHLFIGISVLNLVFMGFIQFDKVKSEIKLKVGS